MRPHILVSGAHDLAGIDDLFQTVRAPAHDTRDGEYGSEQLGGQSQHLVAEAAVEVDIRAYALVRLAALAEQIRAHFLHHGVESELVVPALGFGELAHAVAEYLRAGVGYLVYRVAEAIDETGAVERLFIEYLRKIAPDLVLGLPIADVGLDAEYVSVPVLVTRRVVNVELLPPPCSA